MPPFGLGAVGTRLSATGANTAAIDRLRRIE
jgi:hypothetical protein